MLLEYSNHIVYVDESGDHSLTSIDPTYPVFVLAFCIFQKAEYCGQVVPAITAFKFKHLGHDQVVLHERNIRQHDGDFAFLNNPQRRASFHDDLGDLLENAPFTIIAGVIDKARLARVYSTPSNPYNLALQFCLERLFMHLKPARTLHVIVEKRGRKEDAELELTFRRICSGQSALTERLPFEIIFADKKSNSPGLQLADLVARPIGTHVIRPDQPNRAWDRLEKKLRRDHSGNYYGWGLKIFP